MLPDAAIGTAGAKGTLRLFGVGQTLGHGPVDLDVPGRRFVEGGAGDGAHTETTSD